MIVPSPAVVLGGLTLDVPVATAALVAAAVCVVVALLEARGEGTVKRRVVRTALRATILAAVLAALAGVAHETTSERAGTVVLLADDASRATPEGRAALDALARARAAAERAGGTLRVVPFAASVRGATGPATDGGTAGADGDAGGADRSRLAPALAAAALLASPDAPTTVVVATDARLDVEGATDARDGLDARAVRVRGVVVPPPPPATRPPATRVEAFDVPLEARGPVAVRAAVATDTAMTARLRVDGAERAARRWRRPAARCSSTTSC